jgi:hypothetical protein
MDGVLGESRMDTKCRTVSISFAKDSNFGGFCCSLDVYFGRSTLSLVFEGGWVVSYFSVF